MDGNRELITNGETGWLVEPGNPEALARGLLHVLRHPQEARAVGQAAAERMRSEFSVEAMVDRYDGLYQKLLA